jgi:hypothetical protein
MTSSVLPWPSTFPLPAVLPLPLPAAPEQPVRTSPAAAIPAIAANAKRDLIV